MLAPPSSYPILAIAESQNPRLAENDMPKLEDFSASVDGRPSTPRVKDALARGYSNFRPISDSLTASQDFPS